MAQIPDIFRDSCTGLIVQSDPLCIKAQALFNSGAVFCAFRNWAFNVAGDDITSDFQSMINTDPSGPAGGDLEGSTYPNPIVAPGKITTAKMDPTGLAAGIYGSATQIPVIEFDESGRALEVTFATPGGLISSGQVDGEGSLYPIAFGAPANVVFGTVDPIIALPAAGTYLITAILETVVVTSGPDVLVQFYNITGVAPIARSQRQVSMLNVGYGQIAMSNIITVGAASITVQAQKASGAGNLRIMPEHTSISYVRLA